MTVTHPPYRTALPVSLILLLLAARPLRIPLLAPWPGAVDGGGDTGDTGAPIIAFCLAARMMSLYVTIGESGGSIVDLLTSASPVDASSCPPALRVCVDDVGSVSPRRFSRLRFLVRLNVLDMPLSNWVGVLGVLSSVASLSSLGASSEY